MKKILLTAVAVASLALTACGANTTAQPTDVSQNPKVSEAQSKVDAANQKKDEAVAKKDAAEAKKQEATESLATAQTELASAESRLEEAKASGDEDAIQAAQAEVEAAQSSVSDAQEAVTTAEEEVSTATEEVNTATEEASSAEEEKQSVVQEATQAANTETPVTEPKKVWVVDRAAYDEVIVDTPESTVWISGEIDEIENDSPEPLTDHDRVEEYSFVQYKYTGRTMTKCSACGEEFPDWTTYEAHCDYYDDQILAELRSGDYSAYKDYGDALDAAAAKLGIIWHDGYSIVYEKIPYTVTVYEHYVDRGHYETTPAVTHTVHHDEEGHWE